jgi:serine/threonine-protein kinase ULK/ATG1
MPQKNKSLAAIKMVQRSKLSKKLLENLESEIQILKKLNHPHIVALTDCKKSEKHIHLIMEYCSVGDLSILIKKRDRMPSIHPSLELVARDYPSPHGGGLHEVLVRHFVKQLASALEFLRKDGLVHRDVKPQNLLLNPSPDWVAQGGETADMEGSRMLVGLRSLPVLKLADFGFARVLPSSAMAETLCGSPLYMAPEILRYEKYDATADLWSVGTVLYEMMAGRPPFRAPNHVDLLRKIEAKNDKIDFPSSCVSSDELRGLVRALLKRNPLERMSFEEFFGNSVITKEIPGRESPPVSNPAKVPRVESVAQPEPQEMSRRSSSYRRVVADQRSLGVEREDRNAREALSSSPRVRQSPTVENSALPFAKHIDNPVVANPPPLDRPAEVRRYTTQTARPHSPLLTRPAIAAHATAPARDDLIVQRRGTPMERLHSRESNHSPGQSLMQHREAEKEMRERELSRRRPQTRGNSSRELRNSDEDYVIVDKQQVQVNAFADELATARRGGITPPGQALVRRWSGSQRSSPRQMTGRPTEYAQPKGSYERKYGSSPGTSAKSALAKALEAAGTRLFGVSLSPPNHSPPNMVSQFPPYHGPSSLIVVGNGGNMIEEDMMALQTIEDCANRSDVVYNFAEVKYAQLMPSSTGPQPQGLGLVSGGVEMEHNEGQSLELTPDATVLAAEECMVLFVKVLTLLSKATDVARVWWGATNQHGRPISPARLAASERAHSVVQWIRERYNEVLDKAQFVQEKIIEAQNDLPTNHPNHPCNHRGEVSRGSADSNFMLTTGVTAEKLMYDRALEMSRAAAINELVGDDLPGCEVAYVTSLRLLEAVLEKRDDEATLITDDRQLIEKCMSPSFVEEMGETHINSVILHIRQRLSTIKKKMDGLSRRSPTHSAHGSPHPSYVPPVSRRSPTHSTHGSPHPSYMPPSPVPASASPVPGQR